MRIAHVKPDKTLNIYIVIIPLRNSKVRYCFFLQPSVIRNLLKKRMSCIRVALYKLPASFTN